MRVQFQYSACHPERPFPEASGFERLPQLIDSSGSGSGQVRKDSRETIGARGSGRLGKKRGTIGAGRIIPGDATRLLDISTRREKSRQLQ